MTNGQRNNIVSPATGLMIWCTNCGKTGELQIFNGTVWTNYVASTTETFLTSSVPTSTGGTLVFLAHNLGADTSADPIVPSWKLNGAYIQFGKRGPTSNWQVAPNDGANGFAAAPTAVQPNDGIISGWSTSYNSPDLSWNNLENTPVKTSNDPCPNGFRIPTRNEWASIFSATPINTLTNWVSVGSSWIDSATNYATGMMVNNSLYLPACGLRDNTASGTLRYRGNIGLYWSSTINGTDGFRLGFNNSSVNAGSSSRLTGFSVRCVSE